MICLSVMGNNLFLYSKEKFKPCKWPETIFSPICTISDLFIYFLIYGSPCTVASWQFLSSGQRIFMGSGYLAMATQQQ